jgi:uncharacterized protein YjbJ (UPF0337 family)
VLGLELQQPAGGQLRRHGGEQPQSEGWVERPSLVEKGERMKSSTKNEVKGKFYEVKGKTKERWVKLMNDPTLEGKDENKVGRIQERIDQGERPSKSVTAGK